MGNPLNKLVVRTGTVDDFFANARSAALRADRAEVPDELGRVTLSFEDPGEMFLVLSEGRRRLMQEVMRAPCTLAELSHRLHRGRSAVTRDVDILERAGLVTSHHVTNPGHGRQRLVQSVASRIEVVATLVA